MTNTKPVKNTMKDAIKAATNVDSVTDTRDTKKSVKDLVTGRELDYTNVDDAVLIELNNVMSVAFGFTADALSKLSTANIRHLEQLWKMKLPEINNVLAKGFEFVRGYLDHKRNSVTVTPDDAENLVKDAVSDVDLDVTPDDVENLVEDATEEL